MYQRLEAAHKSQKGYLDSARQSAAEVESKERPEAKTLSDMEGIGACWCSGNNQTLVVVVLSLIWPLTNSQQSTAAEGVTLSTCWQFNYSKTLSARFHNVSKVVLLL